MGRNKFIEFKAIDTINHGEEKYGLLLCLDEVLAFVECTDDNECTNILMKDKTKRTINEKFSDVVKKVRDAEVKGDGESGKSEKTES